MSNPSDRITKVTKPHSALTEGTWVLVADSEKALLLENVGDAERPLLELRREAHQNNPATRSQGTDRPGRKPDSGPGQRSAMDDTDWHRLAQDRFAHDLAEMLTRRVTRDAIARLIVVAAPRVLGALRPVLHKTVEAVIVAELPKDLTHHTVDDIAARVAAGTTDL